MSDLPALAELARLARAVIETSAVDNAAAEAHGGDSPIALATNSAWMHAMQAFSYATTPDVVLHLVALATGGAAVEAAVAVFLDRCVIVRDDAEMIRNVNDLRDAFRAARSLTPERPADAD